MNFKNLEYFIAVCREQSFTKAAEKLYISQSAVSKSVKKLESELDCTLVDRTSKEFLLTDKGEILYEMGKGLLQKMDEEVSRIYRELSGSKGKLVVGIPPVISTSYFSNIVYQFKSDFPEIDLHVIEAGAHSLKKLLLDGHVDLAILIKPLNKDEFHYIDLTEDEAVLLVHKTHPLAMAGSVSMEELKDDSFILLDETYMLYHQIVERAEESGFTPKIIGKSYQWDYICELVGNNVGVSILPRPILYRFHLDNVRILPFRGKGFPWTVVVASSTKRTTTDLMKTFIDYVETRINVLVEKNS